MSYTPGWKPFDNNCSIDILSSSCRSPFFDIGPSVIRSILKQLNAEYIVFDARTKSPSDKTEGYLLFRQYRDIHHVYIPLKGAVVFFSPSSHDFAKHELDRCSDRKLLSQLEHADLENENYVEAVGPGQIAGLLEIMIRAIREFEDPAKNSHRLQAIRETHLNNVPNSWLLSGFAANHSTILRIPVSDFFSRCLNVKFSIFLDEKLFPEPSMDTRKFLRRCSDELCLRQANYIGTRALAGKGQFEVMLARLVSEQNERKKISYGRYKNSIRGPKTRIAWYLNIKVEAAEEAIERLCNSQINGRPVFWKDKKGNAHYHFNQKLLNKFIKAELHKTESD